MSKNNLSLVIGYGEIGQALVKVLNQFYPVFGVDPKLEMEAPDDRDYEYMHVCMPYSETFIEDVKAYQEKFKPTYTIIHSTVPVGTSEQLGDLHSPVRGIHPNLEGGIRVFQKFIGGKQASEVADYFRRAGLKVVLVDSSKATEAMKLFDTEYYRTVIEFAKRVKRFCDAEGLNFHEVYTLPNITYNEGYTILGHPEFVRPVLQPIMTEIGGHCLLPNAELIKQAEFAPEPEDEEDN